MHIDKCIETRCKSVTKLMVVQCPCCVGILSKYVSRYVLCNFWEPGDAVHRMQDSVLLLQSDQDQKNQPKIQASGNGAEYVYCKCRRWEKTLNLYIYVAKANWSNRLKKSSINQQSIIKVPKPQHKDRTEVYRPANYHYNCWVGNLLYFSTLLCLHVKGAVSRDFRPLFFSWI